MHWRRTPERRGHYRIAQEDNRPADAIIVLGCRVGADGAPSKALTRRVERGLELFARGAAPLLLLSGGGSGNIAEACAMADLARAAGVPESALLIETRSHDTVGNARECMKLLRARGLSRIVLVSDRAHLLRAALLFRMLGMEVVERAGVRPRSPAAAALATARELVSLPASVVRAMLGLA